MTFGLPEDDDEQRVPLAVGNSEQRHKKGKPRKFAGLSFWRSLQIADSELAVCSRSRSRQSGRHAPRSSQGGTGTGAGAVVHTRRAAIPARSGGTRPRCAADAAGAGCTGGGCAAAITACRAACSLCESHGGTDCEN
jgi:hypothetical protein